MRSFLRLCLCALLACWPSVASAEWVVLCFTDPSYCQPCRRLDETWKTDSVQDALRRNRCTRRIFRPSQMSSNERAVWAITVVPTTVLVECDEQDRVLRTIRRREGAMSSQQLIKFLDVSE